MRRRLARWLGLILALGLFIFSLAFLILGWFSEDDFFVGLHVNLATTFFGSAMTIAVIDQLLTLRKEWEHVALVGPQAWELIKRLQEIERSFARYIALPDRLPSEDGLELYALVVQNAEFRAANLYQLVNEQDRELAALLTQFIAEAATHLEQISRVKYARQEGGADVPARVNKARTTGSELVNSAKVLVARISKSYHTYQNNA